MPGGRCCLVFIFLNGDDMINIVYSEIREVFRKWPISNWRLRITRFQVAEGFIQLVLVENPDVVAG